MDKTDHCLLVGAGAQQFAQECGIETVDQATLITPACQAEWEYFQKYKNAVDSLFNNKYLSLKLYNSFHWLMVLIPGLPLPSDTIRLEPSHWTSTAIWRPQRLPVA